MDMQPQGLSLEKSRLNLDFFLFQSTFLCRLESSKARLELDPPRLELGSSSKNSRLVTSLVKTKRWLYHAACGNLPEKMYSHASTIDIILCYSAFPLSQASYGDPPPHPRHGNRNHPAQQQQQQLSSSRKQSSLSLKEEQRRARTTPPRNSSTRNEMEQESRIKRGS